MKRLFKKHLMKTYSDHREQYSVFINSEGLEDLTEMVNNPRNLFWDILTKQYALLTPLNNGNNVILTELPKELLEIFKEMMTSQHFHIKNKHPLIEVHGSSKHSSAFLLLPQLEEILSEHIDLNDQIRFLISDRINLPLYVGHKTTIERLAESSDFNHIILTWEEVNK